MSTYVVTNNGPGTAFIGKVHILEGRSAVFDRMTEPLAKALALPGGRITVQEATQLVGWYTLTNSGDSTAYFDGITLTPGSSARVEGLTSDITSALAGSDGHLTMEVGSLVVAPSAAGQQGSSGSGGSSSSSSSEIVSLLNADTVSLHFGCPIYSSGTGYAKAAAGNFVGRRVSGLCADDTLLPGGSGNFVVEGSLVGTSAQWQTVTGNSGGLAVGSWYYLDLNVPGRLTLTLDRANAPVLSYQVPVGYALSSTEFVFLPKAVIRLA